MLNLDVPCVYISTANSLTPFDDLIRVYLAKDPETMQSRGFAFVSYYQKSDAESAMQGLQGYGYDHLILKLEWAKPSLVSFGYCTIPSGVTHVWIVFLRVSFFVVCFCAVCE